MKCLKNLIREHLQWGAKQADKTRNGATKKFLSEEILDEKITLIVAAIRTIYPEFWSTLHHNVNSLEARLSGEVFEILRPELYRNTGWDGLNGYIAQEHWSEFFKKFTNMIYGHNLVELIYPFQASNELSKQLFDDSSLNSVTAFFEEYRRKFFSGNPYQSLWTPDIIKNILAIFLNPAEFEPKRQLETLRVALLDQQAMRGLAFIYWRHQQTRKISEVFDNE